MTGEEAVRILESAIGAIERVVEERDQAIKERDHNRDELARLSWSPQHIDGPPLRDYLETERNEFIAVLGELGLLKAPHGD